MSDMFDQAFVDYYTLAMATIKKVAAEVNELDAQSAIAAAEEIIKKAQRDRAQGNPQD